MSSNFENPKHFSMRSANLLVFVLQCIQRENVHTEKEDGREAP